MKHALPPLDGFKVFEACARHLSFSQAAEELCISKGAISYRIRKLEQALNCRLFERRVRQVYLTDAGHSLMQTTASVFSDLENVVEELQSATQPRSVTIAATTYVAARWLSSRINRFSSEHPDITVQLLHTVDSTSFKLSDADMAIQWGPCHQQQSDSVYVHLSMPLFAVLSPSLLTAQARAGGRAFAEIPLLCEERSQDLWHEWFAVARAKESTGVTNPRRVIADANVRVQAAIDGQGLILADELMKNELDSGLLVSPFETHLDGYGYNFLFSTSPRARQNVRLLKSWLDEEISIKGYATGLLPANDPGQSPELTAQAEME